jgi:hypothetical protein
MSFNVTGGNPRAHRVRVYYFGTSTIYEGMPVCYDNSTTNWHGGSIALTPGSDCGAVTAITTTAEGSQNEGKYIRVENPNADNVSMFAGVVAHGSPGIGGVGPSAVDIYVPNGAVVPVRTDNNCLIDQTILAITTGSQELGVPLGTDSRAVAIARETVDRGTAGLVLAELCPYRFVFQDSGGTALSIDDADTTTGTQVNFINLKFLGTATYTRALYAVGEIAGAAAALYGMFKFRTYISAAAKSSVHTLCANLHVKDAGTLNRTSGTVNSAIYATVETEVTTTAPTLSGGDLCGISLEYYVDETTAAPANAFAMYVHAGTYNWDGLLWIRNAGDCGDAAMTGDHAFDTDDKCIPVLIGNYTGGTTYYIPLMNNKGD